MEQKAFKTGCIGCFRTVDIIVLFALYGTNNQPCFHLRALSMLKSMKNKQRITPCPRERHLYKTEKHPDL
jgi:hypothetical protein